VSAPTVLAFAASLRSGSLNKKLLAVAEKELKGLGVEVDVFDLFAANIPVYNEDVLQKEIPAGVLDLKARITQASSVLIVTPEYNYGIPGVLKNVIDWCSRPPPTNPFKGKLTAHLGATPGSAGTYQAQSQVRLVLSVGVGAWVLPGVAFGMSHADKAFDAGGALTDEGAKKALTAFLGRFAEELKVW
jgi:chromate reductase, NAD(P)H dehydrogenase (quinone)